MLFVVKQQKLTRNVVTCYEAGAFGFHLHRRFEELGIKESRLFAVPTFPGRIERPHVQPAFDLCLIIAMTCEAPLLKERRDAAHEELFGISRMKRGEWGEQEGGEARVKKWVSRLHVSGCFYSGLPCSKIERISAPLSTVL